MPGQFIGQSLMFSPTAPRFATILSNSSLSSDGLSEELKLSTSSDTDCIAGKLVLIEVCFFICLTSFQEQRTPKFINDNNFSVRFLRYNKRYIISHVCSLV